MDCCDDVETYETNHLTSVKTFERCNNLRSNYDCDNENDFPQTMIKPPYFQATFCYQKVGILRSWNVFRFAHKNFCRVVGHPRSNRIIWKDVLYFHEKSQTRNNLGLICNWDNAITFFKSYEKSWFWTFQFYIKNKLFFKVSVGYLSWCKIFVRVVGLLWWCWNIRNELPYLCENFWKV